MISLNLYYNVSFSPIPILPIKILGVRKVKSRGGDHTASKHGFQCWGLVSEVRILTTLIF